MRPKASSRTAPRRSGRHGQRLRHRGRSAMRRATTCRSSFTTTRSTGSRRRPARSPPATPSALCAHSLAQQQDRILSLPALLALVNGRVPLVIEVKSTWSARPQFEANIAQMLAAYKGPVAVMSFDPYCVAASADAGALAAARTGRRSLRRTSIIGRPSAVAALRHAPPAHLRHRPAQLHRLRYQGAAGARAAHRACCSACRCSPGRCARGEQRARALRYADAMIFEGIEP